LSARVRPRLSRTLSPARWSEYGELLEGARERGYELVALEDWVARGRPSSEPTLILRHDVDQQPRAALRMAAIEESLGVSSTWYFRWRTARPEVIARLRDRGFGVGLHYETLTRLARARGLAEGQEPGADLVAEAREVLRGEIASFATRHGPIHSVCPHGDSAIPWISNAGLLRGQEPSAYGVAFDGNEAMRGTRLGYWLTDRARADGSWKDGVRPAALLADGVSPVLCLTHPNNWSSGPSLWIDRLGRAAGRGGRDEPPL
jgi:hypothetical protein